MLKVWCYQNYQMSPNCVEVRGSFLEAHLEVDMCQIDTILVIIDCLLISRSKDIL